MKRAPSSSAANSGAPNLKTMAPFGAIHSNHHHATTKNNNNNNNNSASSGHLTQERIAKIRESATRAFTHRSADLTRVSTKQSSLDAMSTKHDVLQKALTTATQCRAALEAATTNDSNTMEAYRRQIGEVDARCATLAHATATVREVMDTAKAIAAAMEDATQPAKTALSERAGVAAECTPEKMKGREAQLSALQQETAELDDFATRVHSSGAMNPDDHLPDTIRTWMTSTTPSWATHKLFAESDAATGSLLPRHTALSEFVGSIFTHPNNNNAEEVANALGTSCDVLHTITSSAPLKERLERCISSLRNAQSAAELDPALLQLNCRADELTELVEARREEVGALGRDREALEKDLAHQREITTAAQTACSEQMSKLSTIKKDHDAQCEVVARAQADVASAEALVKETSERLSSLRGPESSAATGALAEAREKYSRLEELVRGATVAITEHQSRKASLTTEVATVQKRADAARDRHKVAEAYLETLISHIAQFSNATRSADVATAMKDSVVQGAAALGLDGANVVAAVEQNPKFISLSGQLRFTLDAWQKDVDARVADTAERVEASKSRVLQLDVESEDDAVDM